MSDVVKKLTNQITVSGKLTEIKVTHGVTLTSKKKYISIEGMIQFGDSKAETQRFKHFSTETKKDGKTENKLYTSATKWAASAVSEAKAAKDGLSIESATRVEIIGALEENPYVNKDGKFVEALQWKVSFFNDYMDAEDSGATLDMEGHIVSIIEETKDDTETGRLKISVLTTDFFGNPVLVNNIVVPKDLKEGFESGYEESSTAMLFISLLLKEGEKKAATTSGGLGKQREITGKSYCERILTGASEAIDADDEGAVSTEAARILLADRKAKHDTIKAEGYQGSQGSTRQTGLATSAKKPESVEDEDMPF